MAYTEFDREESWASKYLVPLQRGFPIAEEVRSAMNAAGDLSTSDSCVDRHLKALAYAAEAVALSVLMVACYLFVSVFHFVATAMDQGFLAGLAHFGKDLLSSLQSLAITTIGVFYLASGLIYPPTFAFFAPQESSEVDHDDIASVGEVPPHEAVLHDLEHTREDLLGELSAAQAALADMHEQAAAASREDIGITGELETTRGHLLHAREQERALVEEEAAIEAREALIAEELATAERAVADVTRSAARAEEEHLAAMRMIEQQRAAFEQQERELLAQAALLEQRIAARAERSTAADTAHQEEIAALEARIATLETQAEQLSRREGSLRDAAASAHSASDEHRAMLLTLDRSMRALRAEESSREERNEALREAAKKAEQDGEALRKAIEELRADERALRGEFATLEREATLAETERRHLETAAELVSRHRERTDTAERGMLELERAAEEAMGAQRKLEAELVVASRALEDAAMLTRDAEREELAQRRELERGRQSLLAEIGRLEQELSREVGDVRRLRAETTQLRRLLVEAEEARETRFVATFPLDPTAHMSEVCLEFDLREREDVARLTAHISRAAEALLKSHESELLPAHSSGSGIEEEKRADSPRALEHIPPLARSPIAGVSAPARRLDLDGIEHVPPAVADQDRQFSPNAIERALRESSGSMAAELDRSAAGAADAGDSFLSMSSWDEVAVAPEVPSGSRLSTSGTSWLELAEEAEEAVTPRVARPALAEAEWGVDKSLRSTLVFDSPSREPTQLQAARIGSELTEAFRLVSETDGLAALRDQIELLREDDDQFQTSGLLLHLTIILSLLEDADIQPSAIARIQELLTRAQDDPLFTRKLDDEPSEVETARKIVRAFSEVYAKSTRGQDSLKVLTYMREFPHIFPDDVIEAQFGQMLELTTPLEMRYLAVFRHPAVREALQALEQRLLTEEYTDKERRLVQRVVTDFVLFTTLVPTRFYQSAFSGTTYHTIDPFSPQGLVKILTMLSTGEQIEGSEFFNFYLTYGRTAAQKLLILSLFNVNPTMRAGIARDPLFMQMLETEGLEEAMLASSGHIVQTSVYSCVGAAYNTRLLHKTPHIVGLLHHTEALLLLSEGELERMGESDRKAPAFRGGYHLSKEEYVRHVIDEVRTELAAIRRDAERALASMPRSVQTFYNLTLRWNRIMQKAETIIYPQAPRWYAEVMLEGRYYLSTAFNMVGAAFNPWNPWLKERRAAGGIIDHKLREVEAVVDMHEAHTGTFAFNPAALARHDDKEQFALEFWHELMHQGDSTFTFRIKAGVLHANSIRAYLHEGKTPLFILLNPMDNQSRVLSPKDFVAFCEARGDFFVGSMA